MLPYFAILSLLIYLIIKYDIQGNPIGKDRWVNIFMILLILLAGFRYHIGSDTVVYESWFKEAPTINEIFRDADIWSQPLWMLLLSIVKTISGSYIVFQFVHAIILNTLLFRFLRKTTDKIFTALFFILCITWWNLSFEVLRESLCVVMYLNALLYLKDRKILHYIVVGIIMMGFHRFSFVIMIITPFITFVKEKITIPIFIIISIILFFSTSFLNLVETISPIVMGEEGISHLNSYMYHNENEGHVQQNIFGLLRILLMSFALPITTIIYNPPSENTKIFNRILILVLLFGTLQTKLMVFGRFFNYVSIVLIVCFVNVIYQSTTIQPIIKSGLYILVSLYLYFGCISFYRPSYLEHRAGINYNCTYIPYKTVFQEPDPIRENLLN